MSLAGQTRTGGTWVFSLILAGLSGIHVGASAASCSMDPRTVILNFAYSSEKEGFIEEVTKTFNEGSNSLGNGKKICVEGKAMGSGDMVSAITARMRNNSGAPTYDVISPASDLYVEYGNFQAQKEFGKEIFKKADFLVSSPVVVAIWEPSIAKFGGKSAEQIGWSDISDLAVKDNAFRFGQTSPDRSNSGFSALVAQFYAGAYKNGMSGRQKLGLAEVAKPEIQSFVKDVHSAVVHYGESTGFYVKNMIQGGPSYADAIVAYESDVIAANRKLGSGEKGKFPKLIAVYPKDGSFLANHPYVNLQASWVSEEQRQASEIYLAFLLKAEQQIVAVKKGFRPSSSTQTRIELPQQVKEMVWSSDWGVQPYEANHRMLVAPTGEVLDAVLKAHLSTKKKVQLTLVIDTSGSMSEEDPGVPSSGWTRATKMNGAKAGATQIIETLRQQDSFSLFRFSDSIQEIIPVDRPAKGDSAGLNMGRTEIKNLVAGGGTPLFRAVESAWRSNCQMIKADPNDRTIRIVLVLTDGLDSENRTGSDLGGRIGYGQPNLTNNKDCKIPVFGIVYGVPNENLRIIRETESASACSQKTSEARLSRNDNFCGMYHSLKDVTAATKGTIEVGNGTSVQAIFERLSYFMQ